jgi:hypothetical protein
MHAAFSGFGSPAGNRRRPFTSFRWALGFWAVDVTEEFATQLNLMYQLVFPLR